MTEGPQEKKTTHVRDIQAIQRRARIIGDIWRSGQHRQGRSYPAADNLQRTLGNMTETEQKCKHFE
eukprot:4257234-Pyramimonas_sp.AAC.1